MTRENLVAESGDAVFEFEESIESDLRFRQDEIRSAEVSNLIRGDDEVKRLHQPSSYIEFKESRLGNVAANVFGLPVRAPIRIF